jgi:hypothetical protein
MTKAEGVENCWRAWLSSERRVCDGSSAAIFASMGRHAAAPRLRMAAPNLRRNRTCAASQASYAVFHVQAPSASEPPNAATIAARSAWASTARPRSRSASRRLAAATSAEAVSGRTIEASAASAAKDESDESMGDVLESGRRDEPEGRSLDPSGSPRHGHPLPLWNRGRDPESTHPACDEGVQTWSARQRAG